MITNSPLTLSTEYPNATITVDILEDSVIECSEFITFVLAFHGVSVPRLGFSIDHSQVTVEIRDDEQSKL